MLCGLEGCNHLPSVNLVRNGSAEIAGYDSTPPGWINIQGHWVSPEGDSVRHDCTFAHDGNHLFFAGNDTLGILQQDIDVSGSSADIDARRQRFIFSGYVQSLDQGPSSDQAQIIVTALDSGRNNALYTYNTDSTRSLNKWLLVADTAAIPAFTRFIRIRLIAIRHVGGDNDGYFDQISLVKQTTSTISSAWLIVGIVILSLLATAIIFYIKKSTAKT